MVHLGQSNKHRSMINEVTAVISGFSFNGRSKLSEHFIRYLLDLFFLLIGLLQL